MGEIMYKKFLKRIIDIILSIVGIVVLALPMLIIALIVKIGGGGTVLFRQERIGRNKKPFVMLKFRTMKADAPSDVPTDLLSDSERWITGVGAFLRRTSLDELPQLFNVLAGDMSLIGPRPALPSQTVLIGERDRYGANSIRPGLTGWAQINGRDRLDDIEKARYDGEYLEKYGFFFDLKCFFATVGCVLSGDGVIEGNKSK